MQLFVFFEFMVVDDRVVSQIEVCLFWFKFLSWWSTTIFWWKVSFVFVCWTISKVQMDACLWWWWHFLSWLIKIRLRHFSWRWWFQNGSSCIILIFCMPSKMAISLLVPVIKFLRVFAYLAFIWRWELFVWVDDVW